MNARQIAHTILEADQENIRRLVWSGLPIERDAIRIRKALEKVFTNIVTRRSEINRSMMGVDPPPKQKPVLLQWSAEVRPEYIAKALQEVGRPGEPAEKVIARDQFNVCEVIRREALRAIAGACWKSGIPSSVLYIQVGNLTQTAEGRWEVLCYLKAWLPFYPE
jgi:hypothetical protein